MGWTWLQLGKCVRKDTVIVWNKVSWKGKKTELLVIPGMDKVCFWLEEDWGLEDPCMRLDSVLGHERSWWQWFVAPFLGYSLQLTKMLLFPGKLWNSMYVLCQMPKRPTAILWRSQHYISMISPCIWESRACLASRCCLSWMLFKLAWILLVQRIVSTKIKLEESNWGKM